MKFGLFAINMVRRYADLGVGRLIPLAGGEEKELLEFVTRTGDTLIGRFGWAAIGAQRTGGDDGHR